MWVPLAGENLQAISLNPLLSEAVFSIRERGIITEGVRVVLILF